MRHRLISHSGRGLPAADLLLREQQDCDLFAVDAFFRQACNGRYQKAKAIDADIQDVDVLIFDEPGFGTVAKAMQDAGKLVYGAGPLQDQMSLNTEFAHQLAAAELRMKPYTGDEKRAMTVDAFYVRGRRVDGSLHTTVASATGQCHILRFWEKARPKVYRLALEPLEPFLRKFAYHGPLGVNIGIRDDQSHPSFISFTTAFRWATFPLLCEAMQGSWSDILKGLATGYADAITTDLLCHALLHVRVSLERPGAWTVGPPAAQTVALTTAGKAPGPCYKALEADAATIPGAAYDTDEVTELLASFEELSGWKYL